MFFLNQYIIAVYNLNDECLTVCDNAHELSMITNRSEQSISHMLSYVLSNPKAIVRLFNEFCRVYFIKMKEPEEIWRFTSVPNYIVSNRGKVRRILSFADTGISVGDPLKPINISKCGANGASYQGVRLYSGTKKSGHWQYIHRLVAAAFLIQFGDKPIINHIDSNPQNNAVENLEWTTVGGNNKHAYEHGNQRPTPGCFSKGENSTTRKLAKGAIYD